MRLEQDNVLVQILLVNHSQKTKHVPLVVSTLVASIKSWLICKSSDQISGRVLSAELPVVTFFVLHRPKNVALMSANR